MEGDVVDAGDDDEISGDVDGGDKVGFWRCGHGSHQRGKNIPKYN